MFLNKINQNKITNRNYKSLKFLYKSNLIKNQILTNNFTLFFYYEFLSKENLFHLQNIFIEENLKAFQIKKNILNITNNDFQFFNNLVKNNTLIIFNKNKDENLNFKIFQKLNAIKNIHFFGIFLNKIFLRPSELKKLQNLSGNFLQKNTCKILNKNKNFLKTSLSLKIFTI